MSLQLDLGGIFADTFKSIYADAQIHLPNRAPRPGGGTNKGFVEPSTPAKAQVGPVTEDMRLDQGFSEDDVAIIVLRGSVPEGLEIDSDCEIEVEGHGRHRIGTPVRQSTARTHWTLRCTPKRSG